MPDILGQVYSRGTCPNYVMVVGEAPGKQEYNQGKPFVGDSGVEQDYMLKHHSGTGWCYAYFTNVVKDYISGNPDPTTDLVAKWTPYLLDEIARVQPKLILAVGAFATRWFLGESAVLWEVHGIPTYAGLFDNSRKDRAGGAVVVPCLHPALGIHEFNNRPLIDWDYQQAMAVRGRMLAGEGVDSIVGCDPWEGNEMYRDIGGEEAAMYLMPKADYLAVDTEDGIESHWMQFSQQPGEGMTIRGSQPHFQTGLQDIQSIMDIGVPLVMHNAKYDIPVLQKIGLDLTRANIVDTMYMLYLLNTEPQGLKAAAYRWCRMKMSSYNEVTSGVVSRQLEFLDRTSKLDLPKAETIEFRENDGSNKKYTPRAGHKSAQAILKKFGKGGFVNTSKPKDDVTRPESWDSHSPLYRAWYNTSGSPYHKPRAQRTQKRLVEEVLGEKMPSGNLELDCGLDDAVWYASRDADATGRVYMAVLKELQERGLA